MSRLSFHLQAQATRSKARATEFKTLHGHVETPLFMPVGTQATVRTLNQEVLKEVGSNILLANTYHLLIRPGKEVFDMIGGIHKFMNWDHPVLTDSGGFQIFSLPNSRKITEEGASFKNYLNGQTVQLTPEISIEMQKSIQSDIMMVLDECVPSTVDHSEAKRAMELTHRWASRSLKARGESLQSMFGIVQGACFKDLRKESAKVLTQMPFDGFAIGGLAVGETKEERNEFCEYTADLLPKDLPRYLMGVGTPYDLLEAVHRGVDMFDCTIPVELAQWGVAFTSLGKLQLTRSIYKFEKEPLDPNCRCNCCQQYSKAYLHHLIKSREILGWRLIGIHNLTFYHKLMKEMRTHILEDTFSEYYKNNLELLQVSDNTHPSGFQKMKNSLKKKTLGNYEIIQSNEGNFHSIRHKSSGEVMHSVIPPMLEAKTLYFDQSKLPKTLLNQNQILWDVGLGAGTNAMVTIQELEKIQRKEKIQIISFENDLQSFELACRNQSLFPHLYHKAPRQILNHGSWISEDESIEWRLVEGDFLKIYQNYEVPNTIYFDPFSKKTNEEFWSYEFWKEFKSFLEVRSLVQIQTYSSSTLFRSILLCLGFWVGKGIPTGPKKDTTLIWNQNIPLSDRDKLLGQDWLERWSRSDERFPKQNPIEEEIWIKKVKDHPQFNSKGD